MAATASANTFTFPDRGRAGVIDAAHVLPPSDLEALNREIVDWDRSTGHQLVVATVPDLQGGDIKDYGYQLGRAWALGDKQRNDGAILLLAMKEHKVRIEVGYGLEPVLTDALTSVILHDRVVPHLREGDAPAALKDGAEAIMQAATPAPADAPQAIVAPTEQGFAGWWWAISAIAGLFAALGVWVWYWISREKRRVHEQIRRNCVEAAQLTRAADAQRFTLGASRAPRRRTAQSAYTPSPSPPPSPPPSYDSGYRSSPSESSSSSSWSSPSYGSSDSSSSSSGFDSGGGSFGGGGSDSSW
ncbi:TPM domain-containing protein [Sphingomonas sp. MMS24-J13]|uniref:TPM domain-containing protein n=1 Tax=Sphingomonas sp. MMS24-J13 TaxID=3238686 RepID=UPI00384CE238